MDSTTGTRSGAAVAAFPDLLLAAQWGALRAWVDAVPPTVHARPSILPGWSIDELLSHLATSVDTIALLRPVQIGDAVDQPLPVLAYLTGYQQRSAFIRERSARAAAARTDRRAELDDAWAGAGRALVELGPRDITVHAPGGPIRLTDFLFTRLLELVVHGLDLTLSVRAFGDSGSRVEPLVLPAALDAVAGLIRTLCAQKSSSMTLDGTGPDAAVQELCADGVDDVRLVLLAAGRDLEHDGLHATLRAVLPLF